jgi:UDPglucose--hexose-1-phosphate uridylyltransferase
MPQLRKDPVVGRWVIIASERRNRPVFFHPRPPEPTGERCPFCPGHEADTPPEVWAHRPQSPAPNASGWRVRVVPNKFPALQIEGDLEKRGYGLYDQMNGIGAHEVIIESPDHATELGQHPVEQLESILRAYRARMLDLKGDSRFQYIQVFKNHGEPAGATIEHPHTQLIATPIIPKRISEELSGAEFHYAHRDRCVFCDMIQQEINYGERVVATSAEFVAFQPFAPRFPFETWLMPRRHEAAFETCTPGTYRPLAAILKETITRIRVALDAPAYNFVIHTAPVGDENAPHYHWHFEIMPKVTKVAGFEWGTGFYINPTPPEDAARTLREAQIEREDSG